jgi:preprotein translocase subunit YajC
VTVFSSGVHVISIAFAQTAPAAAASPMSGLLGMLPFVLMFVVLYFLMIRPQMRRQKEHKAMLDALQKGDEVITAGGVLGKITKITEQYVTLEVASAQNGTVEMLFQRGALQTLLPKGTIKAL